MLFAGLALVVLPGLGRAQDGEPPQGGVQAALAEETDELGRCEPEPDLSAAERRQRASEHFDRGRELYEQGSYELAIVEFASAYCHAPNPAPLKNIAQAHERLINYERAVLYLERYILELPPEAVQERERTGFRLRVLQRQPARIRVATLPESAMVTLEGENGLVAKIRANARPLVVPRGSYTMRIEADGYQPVEQRITAEIGQPYSYYFRLEKKRGALRVSASPSDARIFLDKKLVGLGSYVATVPVGTYSLLVEQGNRPPVTRAVEIAPNESTDVSVVLEEAPRSGRLELLIGSSTLGGLLGGSAFASVFDSDTAVAGLGALAGVGIGFVGGFYGIPDQVPVGSSSLIIGSSLWATTEAILLTALITCDNSADGTSDCADGRVFFGAGSLAGVGGLVGSALLARRLKLSAGDAAVINSGGTWGLATGALLWSTFDEDRRARDPLLLAGLNLGLLAGGIIASQVEISRGRSALIDLGGLGGLLVGVAVSELSAEAAAGLDRSDFFALVGMTGGLISAAFLTRYIEDDPQTTLRPTAQPIKDASGTSGMSVGAAVDF